MPKAKKQEILTVKTGNVPEVTIELFTGGLPISVKNVNNDANSVIVVVIKMHLAGQSGKNLF